MSFLQVDSSKVFDTVWRHGILLKLYNLGVTSKLWSLIQNCHNSTSSSNVVNQTQSRWFNVFQGVRQGSFLSSFLYLVFINEIIDTLQQSSMCSKLLNVSKASKCPSLADDISLVALTPSSLQDMLKVSDRYSKKWRFKFNANKSCILRFRLKCNRVKQAFVWTVEDTPVLCLDSYSHLGIIKYDKSSLSDHIESGCRKGRNSFHALTLTLAKLYKSVVIPSVLYGCEFCNNLSAADSQRLHVFQNSICKSVQNLSS